MSYSERPTILSNPHADRVKKVAALVGRSARQRAGLILVEGPQAVRELIAHRPQTIRDVYFASEASRLYSDIVDAARGVTRWVHEVSPEVAWAMSADAQGVIAVAQQQAIQSTVEGQEATCTPEDATVASAISQTFVILAQGRDPGNVGTVIRTADAMGASAVLTCSGTVEVANPKVIRSSAGSIFHLPIIPFQSFDDAVVWVHGQGGQVLGTSGVHGAQDLSQMLCDSLGGQPTPLSSSHAWAMGNEAKGLSEDELAACDHLVFIPMSGHAESLNVASAATICLYASQTARTLLSAG